MTSLDKMRMFSTVYPSLLARYMMQMEMVFKHPGKSAVDVLDVGCGNGAAIRLWASNSFSNIARARGIRYTGVDMFQPVLKDAARNSPLGKAYVNAFTLHQHDLSQPWGFAKDASFDVIWYTEVIEHVPVKAAPHTLRECCRVLRKNGRLLVTTPCPLDGQLTWPDAHLHEFTREEMQAMFQQAKLRIVGFWGTGVNWSHARKKLRRADPENFARLETLRASIGAPLARVAMQALLPDLCTGVAWLLEKA
jgi:SAM-dependent methyltransferase